MPPRQTTTLQDFLEQYLKLLENDRKPSTQTNAKRVVDDLLKHFGADLPLRKITEAKAEGFKDSYLLRQGKLAPATVSRRLRFVRTIFSHAFRQKLITENPFRYVSVRSINPPERKHYVSELTIEMIMKSCNPTWQTILALARYAGRRCGSEVLSLRWKDVDLVAGRMKVTSPKTEHLEGRATRIMPIFPRLRPYLEAAKTMAADGEEYVVGGESGKKYRLAAQGPRGWNNSNLRTPFMKIIKRAGVSPWPKLFHNLRASLETDLMQNHPIHVVTAWIGNTPSIALGHYLQTLDSDFEKALKGAAESGAVNGEMVQNPVQSEAAKNVQNRPQSPQVSRNEGFRTEVNGSDVFRQQLVVPRQGLEPWTR
ncbi:MAG: tyrosine-type recombinase/integrase [Fimbriiglobus sp.]